MDNCPFSKKPCSNGKNFHITMNINGEINNFDCCQQCANQMAPIPAFLPLMSMMPPTNLLSNFHKLDKMESELDNPELHCDNCGISLLIIKAHGRLGCSKCYDHFNEELESLLPQIQNGAKKHNGKEPKYSSVTAMKREMQKAVAEERYEEAAVLRDRIKNLE